MIKEVTFPRHLNSPTIKIPTRNWFGNLIQKRTDIANCLVDDPSNTYYFEVDNNHMQFFGIGKGSIVVVDKSIVVECGKIVMCCVDDEWMIRKLRLKGETKFLCINDKMDACLNITGKEIKILGVVTWNCSPHSN